MREQGLFMVPQKLNFQESVHACEKMSGTVASFTQRNEFEDIVHFLSLRQNKRAAACVEVREGDSNIQVYIVLLLKPIFIACSGLGGGLGRGGGGRLEN